MKIMKDLCEEKGYRELGFAKQHITNQAVMLKRRWVVWVQGKIGRDISVSGEIRDQRKANEEKESRNIVNASQRRRLKVHGKAQIPSQETEERLLFEEANRLRERYRIMIKETSAQIQMWKERCLITWKGANGFLGNTRDFK